MLPSRGAAAQATARSRGTGSSEEWRHKQQRRAMSLDPVVRSEGMRFGGQERQREATARA